MAFLLRGLDVAVESNYLAEICDMNGQDQI